MPDKMLPIHHRHLSLKVIFNTCAGDSQFPSIANGAIDSYYITTQPTLTDRLLAAEVVASFGFTSQDSATLGLARENGRRNPKYW